MRHDKWHQARDVLILQNTKILRGYTGPINIAVRCPKYVKCTQQLVDALKVLFLARPTGDTAHPGDSMSTHGNSEERKRLEMKYFANSEENACKKMSENAESTLRKKR